MAKKKKRSLSPAQRRALAKGRTKLAKVKRRAKKEVPAEVLDMVVYREHTIILSAETILGRRRFEAAVTKDNKSLWFFTGPRRAAVMREARSYIDDVAGPRRRKRVVKAKKKRPKKISYATRARLLKARPKKRGTKNRRAASAHLGAAITTTVSNPSTTRRAKKKGKKNRSAQLGAAAKPSRTRRQRPGEGFAYLVQVQDSNSKKRTRKNPEVDTGTASPARAKQIAAAFLRSV